MKKGRNEPCYCGSGKKYKKCCLSKKEQIGRYIRTSGNYFDFEQYGSIDFGSIEPKNITPYKFDKGINEYLAGLFDLIRQEFEGLETNLGCIKELLSDIKGFSELDFEGNYDYIKSKYIGVVEDILGFKGAEESQYHISMLNARRSIEGDLTHQQVIAIKIINEIVQMIDTSLGDQDNYQDSVLLIGIAVDLLMGTKFEIPISIQNPILEVYVNSDGEIIDHSLTNNNEGHSTALAVVRITKLEELKAYDVIKEMYPKLSKRGRIFLSTAEILYENVTSISHANFDYAVYCTNYFKCIEYELNNRVSEIIRGKFHDIKSGDLTLGSFVWAFKKELASGNQITGLNISEEFLNNLELIKNIRNKANHVEVISLEECQQVREIIIERGLISQICELNITEKNILYCSEEEKKRILETLYDVILPNNEPSSKIRQPILHNQIDAINFMNRLAFIYFNFNFHNPINLFEDRYIVSEIDYDKLGFLLIKKSLNDRKGIIGTHFDYLAHKNGRKLTELLFDCLIDFKEASGSIRVIYEKGRVLIRGNHTANNLKRYLFSQLYLGEKTDSKFKEILNHALDKCLELIKDSDNNKLNIALRQILLTESIWEGFSNDVVNSYKLVKELILAYIAITEKIQEVDNNVLRLMINSCRFIVNNNLTREEQDYLYPYITVYATREGNVLDIKFEDLKSNSSTGTFFEFILT